MGYARYVLPDGREAGYGVDATCDRDGCDERIDRGLAFLCGRDPDGWRDDSEAGCGKYHCPDHQLDHDCTNPGCGFYYFPNGTGASDEWLECPNGTYGEHSHACSDHVSLYDQAQRDYALLDRRGSLHTT